MLHDCPTDNSSVGDHFGCDSLTLSILTHTVLVMWCLWLSPLLATSVYGLQPYLLCMWLWFPASPLCCDSTAVCIVCVPLHCRCLPSPWQCCGYGCAPKYAVFCVCEVLFQETGLFWRCCCLCGAMLEGEGQGNLLPFVGYWKQEVQLGCLRWTLQLGC